MSGAVNRKRTRTLENGQTVEWTPGPWTPEKQAEIDALTIDLARGARVEANAEARGEPDEPGRK